jgi:hypothetical protein
MHAMNLSELIKLKNVERVGKYHHRQLLSTQNGARFFPVRAQLAALFAGAGTMLNFHSLATKSAFPPA